MKFHALHGLIPEEKFIERNFIIDIVADLDFTMAAEKDDLTGSVDYQSAYEFINEIVQTPVDLIEHLGLKIGEGLLNQFSSITNVSVKVCKASPPIKGHLEEVCIALKVCRE